ncbi:DUF389 domain-containing protein [Sphingobium indicum]|uniref:DUF389 domain-containing protein n=1 Tax=Sphingobium indicum TaxID=332055 RepID=UPI0035E9F3F2
MTDSDLAGSAGSVLHERMDRMPLYRWWRRRIVGIVDHEKVVETIVEESGWSPRYLFMTIMSAGIAVLGLLLSSPAVVIGAMLISPLMNPILGLGFSLALFDFSEMRRALIALGAGSACAVAFTALIVALSPLQAPTTEIISRTRPNLFDLGVALFAALAGTFAIIRGRGGTIVGVAIATALMPPLAVVGYGLATWNLPVLGGALALFVTNFVTIALSATVMARVYGFGHSLSSQQSWAQTIVLILVFVVMAIPLAFSLKQIAGEALAVTQVRSFLAERFGNSARVTQLDVDFDAKPIAIRSVIITPRARMQKTATLQSDLARRLGEPLRLQLDQVLLEPGAGALEAQREELRQASAPGAAETARIGALTQIISLIAGVPVDAITLDRDHHRASALAEPIPGASLASYRMLEQRARSQSGDWDIAIVPPQAQLPLVRFADGSDMLGSAARDAVLTSAWAARRWNIRALAVPGLSSEASDGPDLAQRRGLAIAEILRAEGIAPISSPAAGQSFRLAAALDESLP